MAYSLPNPKKTGLQNLDHVHYTTGIADWNVRE